MRVLFCCSGSFGFWVLCQGREVVFCKIFSGLYVCFGALSSVVGRYSFSRIGGDSVLENDGLRPMTLDMSEVEIISFSDSSTTISDTNTTTEATTPKTGDNSDLYVWYIILVAAISVKSHIPDIFPNR